MLSDVAADLARHSQRALPLHQQAAVAALARLARLSTRLERHAPTDDWQTFAIDARPRLLALAAALLD